MFLLLFSCLVFVVCFAIACFYLYRKFYCHRYFKRLGIPGPKPHWLYGNTLEVFTNDRHIVIANWTSKYGPYFGFYFGAEPVLVISSVEAIENVFVKHASDFQGHMLSTVQPDVDKEPGHPQGHMVFARGETWKKFRTICNPAFSTGKMKSYMSMINRSQDQLLKVFAENAKAGRVFEAKDSFRQLTIEVISEVGFGIQLNGIGHQQTDNVILENLRTFASASVRPPKIITMALYLTEFTRLIKLWILLQFKLLSGYFGPTAYVRSATRQIIRNRQQTPNLRHNDILQAMLDAAEEASTVNSQAKYLTEDQMLAQALMLFLAGYETTSSAIVYTSYCLATNQDIQEKLSVELRKHFSPRPDGTFAQLDYETLMNNSIPYLEWVCLEANRLYPVGMNTLCRAVMKDTTLHGFEVPKSLWGVLIDVWTVHRSEPLWGPVDPNKFYPERFSPENSASRPESAFLAFGLGPRKCIGTRLALLQMKLTIANVVLRYRIEMPNYKKAAEDLHINGQFSFVVPDEPIQIKLIPRKHEQ